METIKKKVNFNKSGTGHISVRSILPIKWIEDMKISKEDSEIEMTYDKVKKEITIKKSN